MQTQTQTHTHTHSTPPRARARTHPPTHTCTQTRARARNFIHTRKCSSVAYVLCRHTYDRKWPMIRVHGAHTRVLSNKAHTQPESCLGRADMYT